MYTNGKLKLVHSNGRIVYEGQVCGMTQSNPVLFSENLQQLRENFRISDLAIANCMSALVVGYQQASMMHTGWVLRNCIIQSSQLSSLPAFAKHKGCILCPHTSVLQIVRYPVFQLLASVAEQRWYSRRLTAMLPMQGPMLALKGC